MPESTPAHEIGRRAEALLASTVPDKWILHKIGASADYGIDFYVEAVGPNREVIGRGVSW